MKKPVRNSEEFRVTFSGISLPKAAVDRISLAIQKAVLTEIATLDLREEVGVQLIGTNPVGLAVKVKRQ